MCLFSLRPYFLEKNSSIVSKMSGNGVSPIPDDKILAYIYDDVDDSDIFALDSLDTARTDSKNEDNKECIDIEASEILKENENLKAIVKQLQLEKDLLELRISEVYKTAKAEIERKDRRMQELNEEKNNILFRRNKNFLNRQPQDNVIDTTKPPPEKELTNEELQKFNDTYKIPKKRNLDDKDTGQYQKISENLPRLVLEDEGELKTFTRNDRHHVARKTLYDRDSYSLVGESKCKEKDCHMLSGESSVYGNRSRPRNRSEDRHRKPPGTLSSSPSVKSEHDYKNNHKTIDDKEQTSVTAHVGAPLNTKEGREINNEIKYQQRRKSTSERQVHDLNQDHPKVKNVRCPRTPSGSPPRRNLDHSRSRSISRRGVEEKNKCRSKSEHKGPITPPGSPPQDLQHTPSRISNETNYKSRKEHRTHSRSPHNNDYGNRQKSSFKLGEQNEIQNSENCKEVSEVNELISKKKGNDTLDVKRDEERQCRSKSKEKQTKLQEVKVRTLNTGDNEAEPYRSKSKERNRKDIGSNKILGNDSETHKKSSESDRKPVTNRRHSRRSRSRSHEKDNRRRNFRNRSRSNDEYSGRSPERGSYRKHFKEVRPRRGHFFNRNNISGSNRNPVRRDRNYGYNDWRNRDRDYTQNMDIRRSYHKNHKPPNFSRLREKVLRYSLERAPEALNVTKTNKNKKDLLKENDTDYSDLEDMRLHLSGASDEISSTEDAKERKYDQMDIDGHFEMVKHLGPNILQMDDDELERLLQGKMKELDAVHEDREEEGSVECEPVFSDYEKNQLSEGEDSEGIGKVPLSVHKQAYNKQTGIEFKELAGKDEGESIDRNQKARTDIIEGRIIYSENENITCQPTFRTLFEERQCIKQRVKQNQKINDKIVRCVSDKERNKGSEDKIISDAQQKFSNTFEGMQHVKTTEKQNRNENNDVKRHNKQPKIQETDVYKLENSKLSSDLGDETDSSTSKKKSYNSILEKIEEAKTKHIDFMLAKSEGKTIKNQCTESANALESKCSPIEEKSQYRDPRQNSNSKDLREKTAKEKDACDAHSRQKKKIGLDVYIKRRKADNAESVIVHHSEATTELMLMNDKNIISEKSKEVSTDLLHTTSESDKGTNIIPRDKINNDTSIHPDIQKVAEENRKNHYPNEIVKNRDSKTANEIKMVPENSITNNKDHIVFEYSPVVVTDENDENTVVPVQEYCRESTGDIKDTSSFLHDFSLSEDEDDMQTQETLLKVNTNSNPGGNEKIKILDVTVLKPSLKIGPERTSTKNLTKPESKFNQVIVDSCALDGQKYVRESSECIEQIQEEVQKSSIDAEESDHLITNQHNSAQKLDTEELKKCLEDSESGNKDELRMQDEGLPKNASDQKIAKEKVTTSYKNVASQDVKTEKQKREERMLLLFGKSPSPRPQAPSASGQPNKNTENMKNVKRKVIAEPAQNTKTQNKQNLHKKKTARSNSLDERLLRKRFIEKDDFEEKRTEDQSKSLNNGGVPDPVQYPIFCNNPTYIPNNQNPVAFDSPNRYIRKKIDEYKEITGAEIKDKKNILPDLCSEENRDEKKQTEKMVKKPNEISEPEKKKRSKNALFKIKMFPNQSTKRKGTGSSEDCRQTKKKRLNHSLLKSSEDEQSSSSESETDSVEKNPADEIRGQNKRTTKGKSTKAPNRNSKKNLKRKKSVEVEKSSEKMNTSTESAPISSSQSELNISDEKKCEKEKCKTKLQKKERRKSTSKERGEELQEVVLRRGGRIRKQPGFYQSVQAGIPLNDEPSSKATSKNNKRRIAPIKVGESSNKMSDSNTTPQSINTSEGSDKTSVESNKSTVNSRNSSKRKLEPIDGRAKLEKLPRLGDRASPEKLDSVPLPNIQETLKQCEMKLCETLSDPQDEELPAGSIDGAAIHCEKQNGTFNDSSLPVINLDTKDADLLGTFERGLFENMNDYFCDKSSLSLGSEGRPKSDKDSNSAVNELPKTQNTKEGVNQVSFSSFLKDNTNTSTPIKIPSERKENKNGDTISTVQILSSRSQPLTSNNNSHDKTSQGMSSNSSNAALLAKSYLATPLKRDRRRRIGIVMVDVT